jgi:hypothetical protein
VREVLIGGEDGPVTIRHSIPLPQADDGGASSLLRDSLTALPLGPHHPETGPIAAHARPREAPPIVQRSAAGLPAARAPARSASPTARLRGPAPHQRWVRFQPEQMGAFSTGLDISSNAVADEVLARVPRSREGSHELSCCFSDGLTVLPGIERPRQLPGTICAKSAEREMSTSHRPAGRDGTTTPITPGRSPHALGSKLV